MFKDSLGGDKIRSYENKSRRKQHASLRKSGWRKQRMEGRFFTCLHKSVWRNQRMEERFSTCLRKSVWRNQRMEEIVIIDFCRVKDIGTNISLMLSLTYIRSHPDSSVVLIYSRLFLDTDAYLSISTLIGVVFY